MLKQKINRGFTIIEILVVIIVIIIFVFIAWPNITNWTTDRAVTKEVNSFVKYLEEKKSEVQSGKYGSVSEVVRSALRLLEREEKKEQELINALVVGEESGFQDNFDPTKHLKEIHKKHL